MQKSGKCDGDAAKPHSTVAIFHLGAAPRRTRERADQRRCFSVKMPPHKGKTVQKIDDFPKSPLALRGTRAVSDGVAPPTMLRAALKRTRRSCRPEAFSGCTTYNAACGIETRRYPMRHIRRTEVAPYTMLRAALKLHSARLYSSEMSLHHTHAIYGIFQ